MDARQEWSTSAATMFKRLRWRLRRKYFSNFERNRASAIQIRLRIILFSNNSDQNLKKKNIDEEDSEKLRHREIAFAYCMQNFDRIHSRGFVLLKPFL